MTTPLFDRIEAALSASLETETARLADIVRQRISVPVVRTGGKVIRSKRGEPPRRDTGRLKASVSNAVAAVTNQISAVVYADTPYVRPLNDPSVLGRPVYGSILSDNQSQIVKAMADAILTVKE